MNKKEAIHHIQIAWVSGLGAGAFIGILAGLLASYGNTFGVIEYAAFAVILVLLSTRVRKKSKVASVLLLLAFLLVGVIIWAENIDFLNMPETGKDKISEWIFHGALELVIIPVALGIRGTFEYHRLAKKGLEFDTVIIPYNKSLALLDSGQYEEAERYCEEAIRIDPKFALAWMNKGSILKAQNRYVEAVQYFEKATELNPRLANAWQSEGIVHLLLRNHDDAISCFSKVLEIDAKNGQVFIDRARAFAAKGEMDKAAKDVQTALGINNSVFSSVIREDEVLRNVPGSVVGNTGLINERK